MEGLESFLTRMKRDMEKKTIGASTPFEIFWEVRDKPFFTKMFYENTSLESSSVLTHKGYLIVGYGQHKKVKLVDLRKRAKELGIPKIGCLRKAELIQAIHDHANNKWETV